nr:uncharacterized protein LOC108076800 [Drosophila kikkawai]
MSYINKASEGIIGRFLIKIRLVEVLEENMTEFGMRATYAVWYGSHRAIIINAMQLWTTNGVKSANQYRYLIIGLTPLKPQKIFVGEVHRCLEGQPMAIVYLEHFQV